MCCSSVSTANCYYFPIIAGLATSVAGVAYGIFHTMDHITIGFGISAVCFLCTAGLPGKYKKIRATVKLMDNLKNTVARLQKEREAFATQIKDFEKQVADLQLNVTNFANLNQDLNQSVDTLKKENTTYSQQNVQLENTSTGLQNQVSKLENTNRDLRELGVAYQTHFQEFHKLYENFETFHKMCQENVHDAFERASTWLHRTLGEFHQRCEADRKKGIKLMENLTSMTHTLGTTFAQIQTWVNEGLHRQLVEDSTRMHNEVRALGHERAGLEASITTIQERISGLTEVRNTLQTSVADLRMQSESLRSENTRYASLNAELQTQIDNLQTMLRTHASTEKAVQVAHGIIR